jgi:transposase
VEHIVIETALTLRMLFKLPWRQTEGLLASILGLMGLELEVPDHTTLSRRTKDLDIRLPRLSGNEPVHVIVDATGLRVCGQGQWAAAKWGERGKQGWRKLHIAVGDSGQILSSELTDHEVRDAQVLPSLLAEVSAPIEKVTADSAYDTRAVYEAAGKCGATVVIPPSRRAVVSGEPLFADRDGHIEAMGMFGRRRWFAESGYRRQTRVENTFFRYKRSFGGRLHARDPSAQRNEVMIGCVILNKMAELGMPESHRVLV